MQHKTITAGLEIRIIKASMRDWARIMDIEFVHISKETTVEGLDNQLFLADLAWKLR